MRRPGRGCGEADSRPWPPISRCRRWKRRWPHGETRLVVARADWATVHAVRPHPLLAELPEAHAAAPGAAETSGGEPDLPARLAALPEPERRPTLRALVRAEIADVLGYGSAAEVDDDRGFRDQGFTSLSAVELRNRLTRLTGTPLPSTLVFDYPTPAGLVDHLLHVLLPDPEPPVAAVLAKLGELETLIGELETLLGETLSSSDREAAANRMRRLAELLGETRPGERPAAAADLSSASDDELIDFISNELGIS